MALALCMLLAAAAVLRLPGLADWQLSWDDMWHLQDAMQDSTAQVLGRNLFSQVHGPFHYLVLHGLASASGSTLALRLHSLVPSLLLVPIFYLLGRELFGRGAGLFLAAGAALSYRLVVLGQVLRPYPLELLLLSLSLVCLLVHQRRGGRALLVGYGACALLATLTHVSALIPTFVVAVVWAVLIGRHRGRARGLVWLILNGLLLTPGALWGLAQLHFASARLAASGSDLDRFLSHFYYFREMFPAGPIEALAHLLQMIRFFAFDPQGASAVSWILVGVTCAGVGLMVRDGRRLALALSGGVVALGLSLGLMGIFPFSANRHCVYLIPFLLMPSAYAVQRISERVDGRLLGVAAIAVVALVIDFDPASYRRVREDFDTRHEDLSGALAHLSAQAGPRDVVVVNRVGMQYLNLAERFFGQGLEHVDHDGQHYRYPYDRWILPGGEEHRFEGTRFWACDGVHEWATYLAAREAFVSCLSSLAKRHPDGFDQVWFLIEKPDLFMAFATARPLDSVPRGSLGRRLLLAARSDPLWRLFFASRNPLRTPTTAVFALSWAQLVDAL